MTNYSDSQLLHVLIFVEYLEAVLWAFPSNNTQKNTMFLTGDGCLSIQAEPASSFIYKNWEVIDSVVVDIIHGSWGCWPLDAFDRHITVLLSNLGWPSPLLYTMDLRHQA